MKQSTYILRSVFNNGHRYYILIDNQSKLIFLLGDRKKGSKVPQYEVSQFFIINQNANTGAQGGLNNPLGA